MMTSARIAFRLTGLVLPLSSISPTRHISLYIRSGRRYASIKRSIQEVGIVEPLIVFRSKESYKGSRQYHLLDGHIRFDIIKNMKFDKVSCLVSLDDESYTFNRQVDPMHPLQLLDHIQIMYENGVTKERMANVLTIDIRKLKGNSAIIKDICPAASDVLNEYCVPVSTYKVLRQLRNELQVDISHKMVRANKFSSKYARSLLKESACDQQASKSTVKLPFWPSQAQKDRLRRQTLDIEKDIELAGEDYRNYVLSFIVIRGYIQKLLNNKSVAEYVNLHHKDHCIQLEKIIKNEDCESLATS